MLFPLFEEHGGAAVDPRERILQQISAYEHFVNEQHEMIHSFVSWVFASQPHAKPLRQELVALHSAFQKILQRDLCLLLEDESEAAACASRIVSHLHGNMLLSLLEVPRDTQRPRSELLRDLLNHILSKS